MINLLDFFLSAILLTVDHHLTFSILPSKLLWIPSFISLLPLLKPMLNGGSLSPLTWIEHKQQTRYCFKHFCVDDLSDSFQHHFEVDNS